MSVVKTSITVPEDIYKKIRGISDNFSAVVTEALKEYIKHRKIQKAVSSFGSWGKRDKDSVEMVNEMRKEEGRDYEKGFN